MPRKPTRSERLLDSAVTIPSQRIRGYVDSVRRDHPDADPEEIIEILTSRYLWTVSGSGGAVGAAAAFPVVGTTAALALTAGQVTAFLAASSALCLAVAEVHGIGTEDAARRRALLLSTLVGESGPRLLEQQFGLSTATWGRVLLTRLPVATVKTVNRTLRGRMAKTVITKGSTVFLGRLLPFGIGAVVGFVGSRAMGKNLIVGLAEAFGRPPADFPHEIGAASEAAAIEGDLFARADTLIEPAGEDSDAP
ncbi:hypothetical protein [Ruania zhangjianzhongii]|uniref:hypothetical protein n=1 Tax=Ruania zhangjianzhongii TaxID=2603206 RepID=UPI0011CA02DA|nr:hypothetical protein [Ruania zhangjianzhongii]